MGGRVFSKSQGEGMRIFFIDLPHEIVVLGKKGLYFWLYDINSDWEGSTEWARDN